MGRESNKAREVRRRQGASHRREGTPVRCEGLEVLRWAHGGDAVAVPSAGPLAGRVVFLESAVPGDVVDVEVIEIKERWGRGRVTRVVTASPERREAACAVQAQCGGCPWMIGSAAAQARSREAILRGEVAKVLGETAAVAVEMAAGGDAAAAGELGYRQRLRLGYAIGIGGVKLGFRSRRSHELVDVARCVVAAPALNEAMAGVRAVLEERRVGAAGEIGRVTLLNGTAGVAGWIEPERGEGFGWGLDETELALGRFRQVLGPRSFAQANAAVTGAILERLVSWGRGIVEGSAGEAGGPARRLHAVELFAGSGTLTMALWEAGFAVTAYEVDGRARAGFSRTRGEREAVWHEADLGQGFPWPPPETAGAFGAIEVVVMDPPRTGARALMPWVRASGARAVAYLSCDLATGLRDCAELTERGGGAYRVEAIVGYDMFPHSGHQEVLILLRK